MKDTFGRELNKWDIVALSDEDGEFFMCVVVDVSGADIVLKQAYADNTLDEDTFTSDSEYVVLLSSPSELKIKLDTMKFAGEDL
jgi:hypothetical protein